MPYEILPPEDSGGRYELLPPEEPPKRTLPQELGRQAGLAVRYGAEGLASLPGIFIDPFQKMAGAKTMTQGVSDLLTRAGVPQPETNSENLAGAISRGVASGGGAAGLARTLPKLAGAAPEFLNNIFAQQPLAQTLQAGIGAGAGEATKQAGGGEGAQLLASAITPLGASGAASIAATAGRGARELVRPVTQAGAKQVAADVFGNIASDKSAALANLDEYLARQKLNPASIGVPGSKPTAGAVSADYGLIGGEQLAARGAANPDFAARYAANNEARLAELSKLRANKDQIAAYETRREEITAPLRDRVFDNAKTEAAPGYFIDNAVDFNPVVEKIIKTTAKPEGGRAESEKALTWVTQRIGKYLNEGRTDPRNAYELYKDIGDLVAGKVKDGNGSALVLSGGLANEVKKTLGEQINKAAPGFDKYLETYSRLSKPIERLGVITKQLGGEELSKVTNSTPMVGPGGVPQFPLSQDRLRKRALNIEEAVPVSSRGLPLAPYQRDVLGRVTGDLNAETLARRGGKEPGSDTYQNMATANFFNAILGKTLGEAGLPKAVSGPLNFAFNKTGMEARVQNAINEAYLNPEKMAELLRMSRTKRNSLTLSGLLNSTQQNVYGGLLGGGAQ